MSRLRLILIRHGHFEGLDRDKFTGQIDCPLSDTGRNQAELTAQHIRQTEKISAIYSSPLKQSIDSASPLRRLCDVEINILPELIGISYGAWQNRRHDAIAMEDPLRFKTWNRRPDLTLIPGADNLQFVQGSLVHALKTLVEQHGGETIVAIGHDSSNIILLLTSLRSGLID